MAGLDIEVKPQYRLCTVKGKRALFHRWADQAKPIPESLLMGGHKAGQFWIVVGIIEYEDGTVHEAYPDEIRFVDGLMGEYAWPDMVDS